MTDYVSITGILLAATITIVNVLLGLLVLTRNYRSTVNRLFLLFTIALSLWASSSVISDSTQNYQLSKVTAQLAFSFSFFGLVLIWLFSVKFFGKRTLDTKKYIVIIIASLIVGVLFATELVYYLTSIDTYETGVLYIPYLLSMVLLFVLTIKNFVRVIRGGDLMEKNQARVIMLGFGIMIVCALLTNAILPVITSINPDSLTRFGPLFTVFFTSSVAIAMIKHRLFDIRFIVARFLAYGMLLASLLGAYSVVIIIFTQKISYSENLGIVKTAVPFVAAAIIAISFGPLKKFFDRITNKYFYQDAYEPQALLNDLNSSLVSSIDLEMIIKNTSILIEHYLKPTEVIFYVYKTEEGLEKVFSTISKSKEQLRDIQLIAKSFPAKITSVDDIQNLAADVRQHAVKENIGLIAQLASSSEKNNRVGALVLGPKKSGSLYGKKDYRTMEIIADELVIALQNAVRFEEIQAFNVTLQDKVDDATRKLRKANEKLVALDQTKDDFISMASHQLRTPLTSVKGYVSMVIEGDVGKISKQQKKLLDQAYVSSQRMVYLIADLLNVSRLKTGKFVIDSKPANLAEVVEGELSQLKETAASRQLELVYKKPKTFPILNFDETKIRQVVMNFADNAIYYTPPGGHITVNVEDKGESVEFTVVDDGIGVPKAEQHNLFNKFYRAGNAKKARPDGTGLGLFMAKKVIVAQGGALIFKSVEGKGSTFGFSFSKKALSKLGTTSTTDTET